MKVCEDVYLLYQIKSVHLGEPKKSFTINPEPDCKRLRYEKKQTKLEPCERIVAAKVEVDSLYKERPCSIQLLIYDLVWAGEQKLGKY